jgi:2,3-bisphosphoglycerate-independent phosphoglycerate mutase
VPLAEANRQRDVVAALGYWLLSDRNVMGDTNLRHDLLNVLVPDQKRSYPDGRSVDILNHPEAIVRRLETTRAGCQWLLDRWTELRDQLVEGRSWSGDQMLKALKLLGQRPQLGDTFAPPDPLQWKLGTARETPPDPDPTPGPPRRFGGKLPSEGERREATISQLLRKLLKAAGPQALEERLTQVLADAGPEMMAELRGTAEEAIAWLEGLAAEHRRRAEADDPAARLSFDDSADGERLRRYQFSCSRNLFRSLDTIHKGRKSGAVGARGKARTTPADAEAEVPATRAQRSDDGAGCTGESVETAESANDEPHGALPIESPANPPADGEDPRNEPTAPPIDAWNSRNEPSNPPADPQKPQDPPTPTDPPIVEFPHREGRLHSVVVASMGLLVLLGSVAQSVRHWRNEPRSVTGDHRDRPKLPSRAASVRARSAPAARNPLRKAAGDRLRWRGLQSRLRRTRIIPPVASQPMSSPCKYVIVIPDGAADEPFEGLGGKTALQAASIPEMDRVAREGIVGRSRNVPDRFLPASDVATLSLLGYDPERYYTGRAPFEAAAMGIELGPDDWAIRCNLMTIQDGRLTDFTAGHITSPEGRALIEALQAELGRSGIEFHPGVSYRNLLIYHGRADDRPFNDQTVTDPPHDHPDQPADEHLPRGPGSEILKDLMSRAAPVLAEHPVNQARIAARTRPANAIWLWGQGRAPSVPKFADLHGLRGAIISAVDLVRGVGVLAGWTRIDVPGATGYLDTDYAAKGRAAIEALRDHDIVCVHIEAPDEASHEGRAEAKVEAIEQIDRAIVGPVHDALKSYDRWRIVISPDHSTLLRTRAHDRAPVAWTMAGTGLAGSGKTYDEFAARDLGSPFFEQGYRLMERFLDLGWDFGEFAEVIRDASSQLKRLLDLGRGGA